MGAQQSFYTDHQKSHLLSLPTGSSLLFNKPLYTLLPTSTIQDAIKLFRRRNISSAPVCESDLEFVLVDIMDITAFLSNCYKTIGPTAFLNEAERILGVTCSQIADFSTYNPTLSINVSTPIHTVVQRLKETRTHRMVLVDTPKTSTEGDKAKEEEEIVRLVTQSNLVEFILLNLDRAPETRCHFVRAGIPGTDNSVAYEKPNGSHWDPDDAGY
ncbi:hypothetical protein HDV05_002742 [Chytridiales sp. JEL 0842]|nr:hypothetical protein HDV05_002742 [Chytridiales sp. JEL 0842]